MATIPSREDILSKCVNSLLKQMKPGDVLHICLSGYDHVPTCILHNPGIDYVFSKDVGDKGDAGKFYWAGKVHGYYLSVDDDILYPDGYIDTLVNEVERLGRKAVVTFHGINYSNKKMKHLTEREIFSCFANVFKNRWVHAGGSGVMAFHTTTLPNLTQDIFIKPNMADVCFSKYCQEEKVPIMVVKHLKNYLKLLLVDIKETIFYACLKRNGTVMDTTDEQLKVISSVHWSHPKNEEND